MRFMVDNEVFLVTNRAGRADEVIRQVSKWHAGRVALVIVTKFFVIAVTAAGTKMLSHLSDRILHIV